MFHMAHSPGEIALYQRKLNRKVFPFFFFLTLILYYYFSFGFKVNMHIFNSPVRQHWLSNTARQ